MRATLEQLKAMSDDQLLSHWHGWKFPFDKPSGAWCGCLIAHTQPGHAGCSATEHEEFRANAQRDLGVGVTIKVGSQLRPMLEPMYALRLFYDSLYPQTVEVAPVAEEKTIAELAPSLVTQG